MEELTIEAEKQIMIANGCFCNLKSIKKIKITSPHLFINESSFIKCPIKDSIPKELFDMSQSARILKIPPVYMRFENTKKFESFYLLGFKKGRENEAPSYISMFPSSLDGLNNSDMKQISCFCFPHGKTKINESEIRNDSNILTGFAFYMKHAMSKLGYIGVVLHFCIPKEANSIVGDDYDREYPFCLCLMTNNPDIVSHFSFLYSVVDPIVGKGDVNHQEEHQVPDVQLNATTNVNLDAFDLAVDPDCNLLAKSSSSSSLSFLLPRIVDYYSSDNTLALEEQNHLLYPTFQTLLSSVSPSQIVELVLCMICEFKILFISKDVNKVSFCVIAMTNLIKDLDIILTKMPYIPNSLSDLTGNPTPSISGYHTRNDNFDIIYDLETKEITYVRDYPSIIRQSPYAAMLAQKVEDFVDRNLHEITVPSMNDLNEYNQFIENADKDIFPDVFRHFVHTKYILNKKFISDFSDILTKPFFPLLKYAVKNSLIKDPSNPFGPDAIFNKTKFFDKVKDEHLSLISTFIESQTFTQFKQKVEEETKRSIKFNLLKSQIALIRQNSLKRKRRNSCLPKKMKNTLQINTFQ